MEINAKIVGYNEFRDIRQIHDPVTGKITDLEPVRGSERVFLTLELPDGKTFEVQVGHPDFVGHVLPLLKEEARAKD